MTRDFDRERIAAVGLGSKLRGRRDAATVSPSYVPIGSAATATEAKSALAIYKPPMSWFAPLAIEQS